MPGPIGVLVNWVRDFTRLATPTVDLERAGQRALAEARQLFDSDIWDPPVTDHRPIAERWRDAITEMISSERGLGWTWEQRYAGDGSFEWCTAFGARCWAEAGLTLAARTPFWASCYRLHRWATYQPIDARTPNKRPKDGPYRLCVALDEHTTALPAGVVPRAGDILLVGGVNTGPGKHGTVVESFDGKTFLTIEGNARGLGPDGKSRQGVVRASRPLGLTKGDAPTTYHARWLIRPAPSDLMS